MTLTAGLLTTTCTIIQRSLSSSTTDDYGNEVPDDPPEAVTVCNIQQRTRNESGDGETSDTEWLGTFPADAVFDTEDQIRVDGHGTFEVKGDPWPVDDPWLPAGSAPDHLEATLVRVGSETGS